MKKLLSVFALTFVVSAMANQVSASSSDAERELKSVRKELAKTSEKRDKLVRTLSSLQQDYEEIAVKIEENKDKPKSLQYKNAVKKQESLKEKIAEKKISFEQLTISIDSLNNVIASLEASISDKEQENKETSNPIEVQTISEEENQHAKETPNQALEKNNILLPVEHSSKNDEECQTISADSQKQSDVEEYNVGQWFLYGILIIAVILTWFDFRKKHHCPHCGKWFTLESEGDTRVWEHDYNGKISKRGARKKYICTNCGHKVQFIEWFSSK